MQPLLFGRLAHEHHRDDNLGAEATTTHPSEVMRRLLDPTSRRRILVDNPARLFGF